MADREVFEPAGEAGPIVASVARIDAWLAVASAGDRFVYASRAFLPIAAAGAARMRALAKRGLVFLFQSRSTIDPMIFNYVAVRSSHPIEAECPVAAKTKSGRPTLEEACPSRWRRQMARAAGVVDDEARIVDALEPVLARAARFGRPCPTNRQLGERTGLSEGEVASGLVAMEQAQLIRIRAAPPPTRRRVVMLSTGAETGLVASGRSAA